MTNYDKLFAEAKASSERARQVKLEKEERQATEKAEILQAAIGILNDRFRSYLEKASETLARNSINANVSDNFSRTSVEDERQTPEDPRLSLNVYDDNRPTLRAFLEIALIITRNTSDTAEFKLYRKGSEPKKMRIVLLDSSAESILNGLVKELFLSVTR
ncbi:hypothetical protein [Rubrimonas cliftonensis]|uniref:hypothetical protein n=1 Tax=Rubrimonas cliftonensis TaxID=89524 RepID=UPI00111494AA|nr:hypothetical protein [Rubrimonas cliftonensis]